MKTRVLIIILLFNLAILTASYSQCTPGNYSIPGLYPSPVTGIPTASPDVPYETVITIVVPKDTNVPPFGTFNIDSIGIDKITNVPAGFTWVTDSPTDYWPGLGKGCAKLSGTASSSQSGVHQLKVFLNIKVQGLPIIQDSSIVYQFGIEQGSGINDNNNKLNSLSNSPNPFKTNTTITYYSPQNGFFNFTVCDIFGRIVHQETVYSRKGKNDIEFTPSNFSNGIYIYRLNNGIGSMTGKMMFSSN